MAVDEVIIRELDARPYAQVWRDMQAFTAAREGDTQDEIWLLEHLPVFTQGQAGSAEHLLAPGAIPVVQTDRGGQVTYHGPGQMVAYPLLDLKRLNLGPRALVTLLEQSVIATLQHWRVVAQARAQAPGVYVGEAKIASLGLRIRRGCSYHGLSLNVAMDLEPFQRINPCGYNGLQVTDLQSLVGPKVSVASVQRVWLEQFIRLAGLRQQRAAPPGEPQ